MIEMKASAIAAITGGELHGDDAVISAPVFLSSKDCVDGSIFLAVKGEKVDGHNYVSDAFKNGAVLALTSQRVTERCIVVDDVTRAVSALAAYVRKQLTQLKVVGITGSQGKTTTKELLAEILSAEGETVSPQGNNNNELGLPITILKCRTSTQFCIAEMGARHQGDIAALAEIAAPQIGVVLRVAAAHLGEFGSLEKIAETKSEMISSLKEDGVAILGRYDQYTPQMKSLHRGKTLFFGEDSDADIRATDIEIREGRPHFELVTPEGRSTVALRLFGEHQVSNALAAAAVAHVLGISTDRIAAALSTAETHARWRMEVKELHDLTIINDAYNASPDSMAAALRTLVHLTQERGGESWAFLGNMRELGESSQQSHSEIGTLASSLGVDHLVTVGAPDYALALDEKAQISIHHCSDREEALKLAAHLNRGDVLLCKASRSDGLEVLAENIEKQWIEKIDSEEGESK